MTQLVLAAIFFDGIHVFVSGTRLRDLIVNRIGERAFLGLFSLLSLVGIVWLSWAYARADYLELWGQVHTFKPVALLLMVLAFLFVAIGLTTPSPTVIGGESTLERDEPARGILRVTRHPFLWGVVIWACVHLVLNGDAASLVFFGSFLLLALVGPLLIDAKMQRALGARWERFAAVTSNVPFVAIIQGRNSFKLSELKWWRIAAALILYAVLLILHQWLFGVSSFPI